MEKCDIHSSQMTISFLPLQPHTHSIHPFLEWGKKILVLNNEGYVWDICSDCSGERATLLDPKFFYLKVIIGTHTHIHTHTHTTLPVTLVLWRKCNNYQHTHTLGHILLSVHGFGMRHCFSSELLTGCPVLAAPTCPAGNGAHGTGSTKGLTYSHSSSWGKSSPWGWVWGCYRYCP